MTVGGGSLDEPGIQDLLSLPSQIAMGIPCLYFSSARMGQHANLTFM